MFWVFFSFLVALFLFFGLLFCAVLSCCIWFLVAAFCDFWLFWVSTLVISIFGFLVATFSGFCVGDFCMIFWFLVAAFSGFCVGDFWLFWVFAMLSFFCVLFCKCKSSLKDSISRWTLRGKSVNSDLIRT